MSDLSRFIEARLAETETLAKWATPGSLRRPDLEHIVHHQPRAALAMVEALRAVAKEHRPYGGSQACFTCGGDGFRPPPCLTARSLARAWASHPDYREEWA